MLPRFLVTSGGLSYLGPGAASLGACSFPATTTASDFASVLPGVEGSVHC